MQTNSAHDGNCCIKPHKVFGIGVGKTGTTSLSEALRILGYNCVHFPDPDTLVRVFNGDYDAAADTPIALNFRELYHRFPDAKFILTMRETTSWLDSIETHMKTKSKNAHNVKWIADVRKDLYGSVLFNEKTYEDHYKRHTHDVIEFFAKNNAMDQLLIIDLINMSSDLLKWNTLIDFLEEEDILVQPFPHSNKGRYNKLTTQKVDVFKITGA